MIIGETKQLIAMKIAEIQYLLETKSVMMGILYQIEKDVKLTALQFYQAGYVKMGLILISLNVLKSKTMG